MALIAVSVRHAAEDRYLALRSEVGEAAGQRNTLENRGVGLDGILPRLEDLTQYIDEVTISKALKNRIEV